MLIYIIGFMGSGKTYWGNKWAEKFNLKFLDLDAEIERKEQRTISDIFNKSGEDIFRLIETKALRETGRLENCIVSCGGGTCCFHGNMQWMNEKGWTVYLSASPNYLYANIIKETDQRPLVNTVNEAELLFFTEQKLKERQPFYEQAKIILPAEELSDGSFGIILETITKSHNNA